MFDLFGFICPDKPSLPEVNMSGIMSNTMLLSRVVNICWLCVWKCWAVTWPWLPVTERRPGGGLVCCVMWTEAFEAWSGSQEQSQDSEESRAPYTLPFPTLLFHRVEARSFVSAKSPPPRGKRQTHWVIDTHSLSELCWICMLLLTLWNISIKTVMVPWR